MKTISIFNHVLGPVMRGPSSSHTAGAYHIASMARSLLGGMPCRVVLAFDPDGSYAVTYAAQGADRGFAMGMMAKPLTDDSFFTALQDARDVGLEIEFEIRKLAEPGHPNTIEIDLTTTGGRQMRLVARSIGGGEAEIILVDGRPVLFNGSAYETLLEVPVEKAELAVERLTRSGDLYEEPAVCFTGNVAHNYQVAANRPCP